ncbi:hypothetical protein [Rossellomorea marisflavi]|uniref:hypothetical protein n=1 Tax=Rossellomorea marisflavi TaxID=189381 RepID=UPI003FA05A64
MIKRIREKIKNKEGSSYIEFAIGLMLFVCLTAFTIDLLFVGHKRFIIAQETTDIARVLSVQGGVLSSTPTGYPGGSETYSNSQRIYKRIQSRLEGADIQPGDWEVHLTKYNKQGKPVQSVLLNKDTNLKVDYMESMDVEIKAGYKWKFLEYTIGEVAKKQNVGAVRHSVSEFKYNFDNWEGERY